MQNVAYARTKLKIYICTNKINAIKNAGGNNIAIICDKNIVNQRFFKMFKTIEPWRTTDDIFLLFVFI